MISHDAQKVPGWWETDQYHAHVRSFTDGTNSVEIINVNATGVETKTGSDLIYYSKATHSCVFVQYKKLDAKGVFRPDPRFMGQLERLQTDQDLGGPGTGVRDWRIGAHAAWIKLAVDGPFDADAEGMIKGQYLPLDFVRLLLADDCTLGEGKGRVLGYRTVPRHLNNTQFIEMVKDGWIGTSGVTREAVLALGQQQADNGRSVIMALDNSVGRTARPRL
jgi:hypothetical protein